MSDRKLRVGLIGFGKVGELHFHAYQSAARASVVALADSDPQRRDEAARLSVAIYADAAEMLHREKLDIVCILTPPSSHAELVELAASFRVNVICEKPLALSSAEAQRMIDICKSARVQIGYGASYRFLPAVARAKSLIEEGIIGSVLLLREEAIGGDGYERPLPVVHYPYGGPGGDPMGLFDHGVHLVDTFSWIMKSRIVRVFGRGNISGLPLRSEHLILSFANGAMGSLLYEGRTFPTELPGEGIFSWGASWNTDGFQEAGRWVAHPGSIHVYGTKGALRIFHYADALFLSDRSGLRQVPLQGRVAPYHFATQLDAFCDDLLDAGNLRVSAEDGLEALKVLEAAYRSAKDGTEICL